MADSAEAAREVLDPVDSYSAYRWRYRSAESHFGVQVRESAPLLAVHRDRVWNGIQLIEVVWRIVAGIEQDEKRAVGGIRQRSS